MVEYLLLSLRKERIEEIKNTIASILARILKLGVSFPQLRMLMRACQYRYHEFYPTSLKQLVSEYAKKDFIQGLIDITSYCLSLKCMFSSIIQKLVQE